jgi:hypothetical protein
MKKIFIIILSIFGLISCTSNDNNASPAKIKDTLYINSNLMNSTLHGKYKIKVIEIDYNNHQYLYFMPYSNLEDGCIVHDPDCPCNKNNSM